MSTFFQLKDHFKEYELYLSRSIWALALVIIGCLLLLSRLIYLQVHQHDVYAKLSLNNQVRLLPISPKRGLIYDRHNNLLAENISVYSLSLLPAQIKNLPQTIAEIKKIIPVSTNEEQNFYKQLKVLAKHQAIPLKINLSEDEVAKFAVEQHNFSGVSLHADLQRYYPDGTSFAHVIGYLGTIDLYELQKLDPANYRATYQTGKSGIEHYYENLLHGKMGYKSVETDSKGRQLQVLESTSSIPGSNLTLSLDKKLQEFALSCLIDKTGSIVAIDPNNGDVLAMVSSPSFDPNQFITRRIDKDLLVPPTDRPNPLFNRSIQGQYPPGSTIKPILALRALNDKIITPKYKIFDPGWFKLPNDEARAYRDWKLKGHGWVDVNSAIRESCSTFFYDLAYKLGIERLNDTFFQYGFGEKSRIDISHERAGLVPTPKWKHRTRGTSWFPGETLSLGIGQSYMLVTPIQLAHMTAIIANRGRQYQPRLLIKTQGSQYTSYFEPQELPRINIQNPEHWDIVINAMREVINHPQGTSHAIKSGLRYTVAGKTGTAQVFSLKSDETYEADKLEKKFHDHSWFIGFAPVDKPKIAIAVILEHERGSNKVARAVMDYYLNNTENFHNE